ncbi:MAG: hypothetical protein FJ088_12040, partial [Deltaproteobacteria bacterium]|nr:hypothetical protein [Deltaproteobacteria bacterium]
MENFVQRVIVDPFDRFIENVILFLPDLFSSILILAAGFIIAWLVKILLKKVFIFFAP